MAEAYLQATQAWIGGSVRDLPLANNVALDRDLDRRDREIAEIKRSAGTCANFAPITAISAMEGMFNWNCTGGKVTGRVQRGPLARLELQVLEFKFDQLD